MIFVFLCLTCEGNIFSFPISASKKVTAFSMEESLTVRQRMGILCLSWGTACLSHLGLCGPGTAWNSTISYCEQATSGWSFLLFVSWCSWIAVFGNWEGFATCQLGWLPAWWKSLSWSLGCVPRVPGPNCTVWSGARLPSPLPRNESTLPSQVLHEITHLKPILEKVLFDLYIMRNYYPVKYFWVVPVCLIAVIITKCRIQSLCASAYLRVNEGTSCDLNCRAITN